MGKVNKKEYQNINFKIIFGRQKVLLRAFSSGIGKSHLLLPVTFLAAMGAGSALLGLIYYIHELFQVSSGTIGLFTSTYFLSYLTGCFVTRPLGRKLLPRYSIILATSLMTLSLILILLFQNLFLNFILIILYGSSTSLFFPPTAGWMSSGVEGPALSKTIARWNSSWSVGTIISPYIAGYLSEINIKYPIIFSIGIFLFCSILVSIASLFLKQIKSDKYHDTVPNAINKQEDNSTFLRFPSWLLMFSVFVMAGVISNLFPVYAREEMGISESSIGILLLIKALFSTVCFVILGKTIYWHFRPKLIMIVQMLLMFLLIILIFVKTYAAYFLLMPVIGIIVAISYSLSLFHGTSGSLERGKRTAIHEIVLSAGLITGSTAGGQILRNFSIQSVYLFCLIIAALIAVIQTFLLRKNLDN